MKFLALVSLAAISSVAQAGEVTTSKLVSHRIVFDSSENVKALEVSFKHILKTLDGCNHFGISGNFRSVPQPEGTSSIVQDILADFGIFQTEMACADLPTPRTIEMTTKPITILPIAGMIYANIIAPEGFELIVTEVK